MNNLIILNKNDNVAVTPFVISPQTKIESQGIVSVDPIPFGPAAFYLKSVAPPHITLIEIFRGFGPFICLQIIVLLLVMFFPGITQTFHTFG